MLPFQWTYFCIVIYVNFCLSDIYRHECQTQTQVLFCSDGQIELGVGGRDWVEIQDKICKISQVRVNRELFHQSDYYKAMLNVNQVVSIISFIFCAGDDEMTYEFRQLVILPCREHSFLC